MARGLTAMLAAGLLIGAGCGASDRVDLRVVAPSTTAAPSPVAAGERDRLPVRERVVPTTRASRGRIAERGAPKNAPRPPNRQGPAPLASQGSARSVSSTAYCERGRMANGQNTYDGAVAMNGQPFGTRWRVLSGPYAGRVLTVADRIGHSSQFDIAMPGRCGAALDYGRRTITVERVA